jgi:pimeloyl-ACP methyl ester carboxylesterase
MVVLVKLLLTCLLADGGSSHMAKLGDAKVHYVSHGEGDQAIVFVHGWTCNGTFWRKQLPALEKYRVLVVDLPGHGESDKPEVSYTMDHLARGIDAVMRDAGVARAVLVGHSMGVPVVRQFYRLFPDKTLALVLVDGALRPFGDKASSDRMLENLRTGDFAKKMSGMLDYMLAPMKDQALKSEIRAAMLATPKQVALSAFEGMADPAIFKEDPIAVPVMAIIAKSPSWQADTESFLRGLAPQLEFHWMEDVSHFLMLDAPDQFNALLVAFLGKHPLAAH